MATRAPAFRPGGVPRRAAPAPFHAAAGERASGTDKGGRVAPMARDPTACRAGAAADGFCATKKALVNGVAVEIEAIPVGVYVAAKPAAPVHHHHGVVAREAPVFRDRFEGFSVPRRSRSKLSRSSVEAEEEVVLAVGREMSVDSPSPLGLLRKRMASELDALRDLLKKAELISSRKSAPEPEPVGKNDELEAAGGRAPSAKRRKVSPPVVEKKRAEAPRMSPDERDRLADQLASLLAEELPGHVVEFLQKHFSVNAHGEMEIDVHSAEDRVLFELKAQLDKVAEERLVPVAGVLPEDEEVDITSGAASPAEAGETGNSPCSGSSDSGSASPSGSVSDSESDASSSDSDSDGEGAGSPAAPPAVPPEETDAAAQPPPEVQPEELQDESDSSAPSPPALPEENASVAQPPAQVLSIAGMLAKAKVRRELLEVERTALPEQSIRPRDLRRLCIAEYGRPSVTRQLGLFPKADA